MWQYIAITIIGIGVVLYLIDKLFPCLFKKTKKEDDKRTRSSRCDACPGCILYPKDKK